MNSIQFVGHGSPRYRILMWFIYKLIVAVIAFFVRLKGRRLSIWNRDQYGQYGDISYLVKRAKDKHGNVLCTSFRFPLSCQVVFRLTKESAVDRFFKSLGMATEFQTRDHEFDKSVYIASDSTLFRAKILQNEQARRLILGLVRRNVRHVTCDGSTFEIQYAGEAETEENRILCFDLYRQFQELCKQPPRFLDDPFALRILVVEASIWSLTAYAISNFVSFIWQKQSFLDFWPVVTQGLIVGLLMALVLFAVIVFYLRGSSRGHRILVESFLLLCVSIPTGGVSIIADMNIEFDKSPSVYAEGMVADKYVRSHRRRRGGQYNSYHIHYSASATVEGLSIPRHVEVTSSTYDTVQIGKPFKVEIGRGFLNHPWYRSMGMVP